MVSLEMEIKEAPNSLILAEPPKSSRKRSSCPNLKMYVKDQNGEVRGMDVDLSPTMGLPGGTIDVETSYIEEKCCFLVPNGFMSGKKDGRRSSAEVRKVTVKQTKSWTTSLGTCVRVFTPFHKKFRKFIIGLLACWQSLNNYSNL